MADVSRLLARRASGFIVTPRHQCVCALTPTLSPRERGQTPDPSRVNEAVHLALYALLVTKS